MSQSDAEQKCMICRAIGFVVAAVIVGLIAWWLFGKVAAWLAVIAFLGLFALGLWLVLKFCGQPEAAHGAVSHHAAHEAAPAASSVAEPAVTETVVEAEPAPAAEPDPAPAQAARIAAAVSGADVAEAAALAEVATRAAEAEVASNAAPAAKAPAPAAAQAGAGTRPAGLDAPRDGKADNLKEIKGVGPKMEKLCNTLGFWHFDQIAAWTGDEVAWVDQNLEGFKGRVTRDNWVEQAKILAAGGETEFSKRVEKGGVY